MSQFDEYVRTATKKDVVYLAKHLRQDDVNEAAAWGKDPFAALVSGFDNSTPCLTFTDPEGNPAGMFGVVPQGRWGAVWMLGTNAIERWPITFLKRSKPWVERLNVIFPLLYNVVDERNTVHIAWLSWCGFEFAQQRMAYRGTSFKYFARGGKRIV